MNILVFVKQVPDTDDVKLDPRTGNLMRDGVQSVINPFDANGVETALQLKEQCGGKVIAISMGPPQADDVLKKALAMGCDESVLLSDRRPRRRGHAGNRISARQGRGKAGRLRPADLRTSRDGR